MVSPRHKNKVLHVLAVPHALVREVNERGEPLADFRHVGCDGHGKVKPEGQLLPYHKHYVAKLKEGSLLAVDLETAKLAGVPLHVKGLV
jgi:hypothetical protein